VDDLGCDAAQGYLMGRPVPPEEFDLGPVALRGARHAQTLGRAGRLQKSFAG
jgi:hypothetical protein